MLVVPAQSYGPDRHIFMVSFDNLYSSLKSLVSPFIHIVKDVISDPIELLFAVQLHPMRFLRPLERTAVGQV